MSPCPELQQPSSQEDLVSSFLSPCPLCGQIGTIPADFILRVVNRYGASREEVWLPGRGSDRSDLNSRSYEIQYLSLSHHDRFHSDCCDDSGYDECVLPEIFAPLSAREGPGQREGRSGGPGGGPEAASSAFEARPARGLFLSVSCAAFDLMSLLWIAFPKTLE